MDGHDDEDAFDEGYLQVSDVHRIYKHQNEEKGRQATWVNASYSKLPERCITGQIGRTLIQLCNDIGNQRD